MGVSLLHLVRQTGSVYSCYRAVWPTGRGKYKKRAFSLKKYGKRAAFKLAVRARQDGLAGLARALRDEVDREIERRVTRGRAARARSPDLTQALSPKPLTRTQRVDPTPVRGPARRS